jgi:hypothetical protein
MLPLAAERAQSRRAHRALEDRGALNEDIETLRPIADIVAVAFATQSLARALGRSQM